MSRGASLPAFGTFSATSYSYICTRYGHFSHLRGAIINQLLQVYNIIATRAQNDLASSPVIFCVWIRSAHLLYPPVARLGEMFIAQRKLGLRIHSCRNVSCEQIELNKQLGVMRSLTECDVFACSHTVMICRTRFFCEMTWQNKYASICLAFIRRMTHCQYVHDVLKSHHKRKV